jgi:hypothetical protein
MMKLVIAAVLWTLVTIGISSFLERELVQFSDNPRRVDGDKVASSEQAPAPIQPPSHPQVTAKVAEPPQTFRPGGEPAS